MPRSYSSMRLEGSLVTSSPAEVNMRTRSDRRTGIPVASTRKMSFSSSSRSSSFSGTSARTARHYPVTARRPTSMAGRTSNSRRIWTWQGRLQPGGCRAWQARPPHSHSQCGRTSFLEPFRSSTPIGTFGGLFVHNRTLVRHDYEGSNHD